MSQQAALAVRMTQLARTTGCEHFQKQLLALLLKAFGADHGSITLWHPGGFVAAVASGYDLAAMSADWHAVSQGEFDFLNAAMHAQPGSAIAINTQEARWAEPLLGWREFLRRYDIAQVLGLAFEFDNSQTWAHVNLNRGAAGAPFTPSDIDALTLLSAHVREAMLVNRLFASAAQGMPFDAQRPAAIADDSGWLLFPNAAFVAIWATLAVDKTAGPRISPAWLNGERQTVHRMAQAGWRLETNRSTGSLRLELHPVQGSDSKGTLTARQLEIAQLYCQGLSCKDIGSRIGLSPATVRVHLRNAYARAAVGSRAELRAHLAL